MFYSKATQNIIIRSLKFLFFLICAAYIYHKIRFEGFQFTYFINPQHFSIFLLLMILNWNLEAQKWKKLTSQIEPLSNLTALKATLAGLSFGLLTPNRLGNFVGKILYLKSENRVIGTLFALYGNFSQLITTLIFGSLCFALTYQDYYAHINWVMAFIPFVFSLLLLALFLFPSKVHHPLFNRIFSKEINQAAGLIADFNAKGSILVIAALRHLVFTVQYLIVLSYDPNFELMSSLLAIQVIFLFTTMIPSLVFGKMMVRGPVAVFVLGNLGYDVSFVLSAILFIWMINIALPSLIGSFLFMVKKRA